MSERTIGKVHFAVLNDYALNKAYDLCAFINETLNTTYKPYQLQNKKTVKLLVMWLLVSVVGEVFHGLLSFVCVIRRLSVDLFIHTIKVGETRRRL